MPQPTTTKKKSKPSKPRSGLTERNQVRSAPGEWEAWQDHAATLGFGGASPWLRKLANDALAASKTNGSST